MHLKMKRVKRMKKYKRGFVAGFFDILHEGHIRILEQAKSQCEQLIVVVGTDEFMRIRKGRESVLSYDERVCIVSAIKYVDKVVPEIDLDKISAYQKYKFDVMFAGDDHENEEIYIKDTKLLKEKYGVDTIYIKRNDVSSTKIRERVCALKQGCDGKIDSV